MYDFGMFGTDALVDSGEHRVFLSLMGSFQLGLDGETAPIRSGSKVETLLVRLALSRQRRTRRESLIRHVWPGTACEQAGQSLNTLTYEVNKLCSPHLDRSALVVCEGGYYHLNDRDDVSVDVDLFDVWRASGMKLLDRGNGERGLEHCQRALTLYRGELAGGTGIDTIIERERLRVAHMELLARVAQHTFDEDRPVVAMRYVRRLLAQDPCREDAHRLAMRCYVRMGLRSQALRQFQLCCQLLESEFGAQPEPATVALFDQIRMAETV